MAKFNIKNPYDIRSGTLPWQKAIPLNGYVLLEPVTQYDFQGGLLMVHTEKKASACVIFRVLSTFDEAACKVKKGQYVVPVAAAIDVLDKELSCLAVHENDILLSFEESDLQ